VRPLVVDVCCGVGGAARGFRRLGFDVLGVDLEASEKYPGMVVEADVRDGVPDPVREAVDDREVAAVWASPPCHPFTTLPQGAAPDVVDEAVGVVEAIVDRAAGRVPAFVENVPGARERLVEATGWPEAWILTLSGETERFDLGVRKRRLVACNFVASSPPRERVASFPFGLSGREAPAHGYRRAHGFHTVDPDGLLAPSELREAIPPAYVREVVRQAEHQGLVSVPNGPLSQVA
jgi:site-specific DNA-cytosine methylase